MKVNEFKLRFITGLNNMIDTYYGSSSIVDKFMNSTLKVLVRQKSYIIEDTLNLFADKDGCIDEQMIIDEYAKIFENERIIVDIRDYIKNDFIKGLLPDKALVIKAEDIMRMLK